MIRWVKRYSVYKVYMAKSKISRTSGGNGGIGGSGIFGMIGTGVVCQSTDNSMYCTLVKFISIIYMLFVLMVVILIARYFIEAMFVARGRKGGFFG